MQQLVLDIEDSRYTLLLQFLRTLDYVKVMPDPTGGGKYHQHRTNWPLQQLYTGNQPYSKEAKTIECQSV